MLGVRTREKTINNSMNELKEIAFVQTEAILTNDEQGGCFHSAPFEK